ncbi:MAG: ABC transporter substrate-binding protein [Treponema sp.]|nr:ABC transporter substrate-binding protein [Treponema sp.]
MCKNKSRLRFVGTAVLAAAVLIAGVLAGCTKPAPKEHIEPDAAHDKLIVGFSQIGAESAWRIFNSKSMQSAADKEGIQLLFSNAEQKQENQIKAIRSFIMYQVDVIVFVPIVQDGWDLVLKDAKDAGIPVIICDRKIVTEDESLYAGYIGTDSAEEGRNAAKFLQKKYADVNRLIRILEIRGTDGSSASDDRMKGFHEIIDSDTRFSIVYSESGDFMRSRGKEIARNILEQNGNRLAIDGNAVDVILSANDGMTLGFLEVLNEHGIKTGSDITVVTFDAQQEAMDRLIAGEINCVLECNPDLGMQVMSLVKKVAAHEHIPRSTHVAERVFSEFDDLSDIAPRGY